MDVVDQSEMVEQVKEPVVKMEETEVVDQSEMVEQVKEPVVKIEESVPPPPLKTTIRSAEHILTILPLQDVARGPGPATVCQ